MEGTRRSSRARATRDYAAMEGVSDEEDDGRARAPGKRGKLREMNPVEMFTETMFGEHFAPATPHILQASAVTADWLRESGFREPVVVRAAPNVVSTLRCWDRTVGFTIGLQTSFRS
eukprot:8561217-Pyramimonas_sp.AAC.1